MIIKQVNQNQNNYSNTKTTNQNTKKNYNDNQIKTCKLIIFNLIIGN